jgi:hypothetical protein
VTKKYKVIQHQSMGRIVVATDHYAHNELVCIGKRTGIAPIRDTHSLQVGEQEYVYLDEPAQLFSHSCEPNMYIMDNEFGGYNFYAARKIQSGEVLAFHYGMSEAESIAVSVCHCGATNCSGKSIGFKEASPDLQAYLYHLGVATYLRKWYESKRQS